MERKLDALADAQRQSFVSFQSDNSDDGQHWTLFRRPGHDNRRTRELVCPCDVIGLPAPATQPIRYLTVRASKSRYERVAESAEQISPRC